MSTFTEPVYHDYPYSPFFENFLEILKVIIRTLGLFAWCFMCLGIFGLAVYLYEKRREKKEIVHVVKGNGWIRYYTDKGWTEETKKGILSGILGRGKTE